MKLSAALWLTLCVALSSPAFAREAGEPQRFHTVYAGQRLASIAKRYKVSVEAIRNANGLGKSEHLKAGQKLVIPGLDDPDGSRARALYPPQHPTDVVKATALDCAGRDCDDKKPSLRAHKVSAGQRLESIAKRYRVSVEALCAANGLARRAKLRPGQVLVIPSAGATPEQAEAEASEARHGAASSHKRGYVDLYTYSSHYRGVVLDKKGNVTPEAINEVSKLFDATGTRPRTDARLIKLIAKVSEKFGKPLRIVSGYRTRSFYEDSRHKLSRAVDFSIPGVSNETLRDYLRSLADDVGVGYYPRSSFVHLDVRDTDTYWVDYAGPGERPRAAAGSDAEAEADLRDPEVAEGERSNASAAPEDSAPAAAKAAPAEPLQAPGAAPAAPAAPSPP